MRSGLSLQRWKPRNWRPWSLRSTLREKLYRHRPQIAFPKNKLGRRGGSGSKEQRQGWKTNEGGQGGSGSQEQPRMEIMKGDELGRQGGSGSQGQPRMEIMKGDKWRDTKGDKAAAASRPFGDFGDQQPSHWEVRTPIASSYLGNEGRQMKKRD